MLVGILSDTHGSLKQDVIDALEGVDCILHAGDIGRSAALLNELEMIAPVYAVLGNNDWPATFGITVKEYARFEIEGVRFVMAHIPADADRYAQMGECDVVVSGHLHIPHENRRGSVLYLNPGSCSRPRGGSARSIMLLKVENGVAGPVRLVELS